ncbi:Zinc transporter [Recurvomyces mirabilis]|uniref:Zinc transporter n=1 Tax=Recurvomyces mirabilis TaxID=574656 RepID=A0AAE1C363_9PEZI|nr:Zinc transporter [Recurvomyces mirabilis]KAK5153989.1 Zinc transporter [Recurvomyces mirabilis]
MGLSNDERGWIMTVLSGIACVLGASIICVDIIVRQFPGKRDFKIQDSDTFLSASLSLSFGVMMFSALYSMLPNAKKSLQEGGFAPKEATWIMIGCFLGGVVGITIVSRIIHRFIPSHVVDCEHSHDDEGDETAKEHNEDTDGHVHENGDATEHEHQHKDPPAQRRPQASQRLSSLPGHMHWRNSNYRNSPSAGRRQSSYFGIFRPQQSSLEPPAEIPTLANGQAQPRPLLAEQPRRPTLQERLTSTITRITSTPVREACGCDGPCYGYSEPCGQDCFKNVSGRGGFRAPARLASARSVRPLLSERATVQGALPTADTERTPLLQDIRVEPRRRPQPHTCDSARQAQQLEEIFAGIEDLERGNSNDSSRSTPKTNGTPNGPPNPRNPSNGSHHDPSDHQDHDSGDPENEDEDTKPDHHHHHVPQNAFLSLGLQTSIAIALHKLPEGFITYATNHANPTLGLSVFLALFIHNITEGFALALPLYLALNNRLKAMLVAFVLGGLSQPLGAGVAALWFWGAGDGKWEPREGVYGGMFAVTSGILAVVGLQLFGEAVGLSHRRGLCLGAAVVGMGVMGVSSALTA